MKQCQYHNNLQFRILNTGFSRTVVLRWYTVLTCTMHKFFFIVVGALIRQLLCPQYCTKPALVNQTVLCSVRDFHSSLVSAAEWCQQLMMLDRSNNLTLLIVSHRPVANGIPAIRGLWWSSSLCTPALPFYIPSLSIWHTLCQQQLIMCLQNPAKKTCRIRKVVWLMVKK